MGLSAPPPDSLNRHGRKRALISHTSILILSGFLIGAVVHRFVPAKQELYVLASGAVGLLAYLAFDISAGRRRAWREKMAEQEAANHLQSRLNRHLILSAKPRTARSSPAGSDWHQYVPVSDSD